MAELLAPAGNVEALDAAVGEGADAVYLGLKSFNARLRSSNFAWNQFEGAVESLHRQHKKIYVTVNTVVEESETERMYRFLAYLDRIGPDGLIVQDFGVVRMVQEFFPNLKVHASTQMNVESAAAANLLGKQGLNRVVVARELGLEEIKSIKANSKVELEMFVHGALCVSESGLCLFSSYLGGKSANRGMCTQACRRFYTAEVDGGTDQGYYFSPCDLELIDHIPDLITAGVDSFKIEGRMKSAEYVGSVVAAYRYLMDHWQEDKKGSIAAAHRMLATDFARSKTTYWYNFSSVEEGVKKAGDAILNPDQAGGTGIYLGKIDEIKAAPESLQKEVREAAPEDAAPEQKGVRLAVITGGSYDPDAGDSIRLHRKDDTGRVSHKVRYVETDEKGKRWVDIPLGFTRGDSVYLLQTKSMSKRYPRVLPADIGKYRQQPLAEKLPVMDLTQIAQKDLSWFPEGLYIQVSTVPDVYVVQAEHPVRIILELNHETKRDLLATNATMPSAKPVLPVSKKQVIISLDPYCPEGIAPELEKTLDALIEQGYTQFVANNLAHVNMLRGKPVRIIGGPYLYTFNRWAVSFLENQNIDVFIPPVENNELNLDQTFGGPERSRVLLTVFAYPALFRMRFQLPASYGFTFFSDKEGMDFKLVTNEDGTFVMPDLPFSIADKAGSLNSDGFRRLLIDYSRIKARKAEIREITAAYIKHQALPNTGRFNWKDGFYSAEQIEAYKSSNERAAAARQAKSAGPAGGRSHGAKAGSYAHSRPQSRRSDEAGGFGGERSSGEGYAPRAPRSGSTGFAGGERSGGRSMRSAGSGYASEERAAGRSAYASKRGPRPSSGRPDRNGGDANPANRKHR